MLTFAKRWLNVILTLFWIIIFAQATSYASHIGGLYGARSRYPHVFIWLLACIFLLVLISLTKLIRKSQRTKLIAIFFFLILITGQTILLWAFNPSQITDAYMVQDQALAIAAGIQSTVEDNFYFRIYGNNNLLLILFIYINKLLLNLNVNPQSTLAFSIIGTAMVDLSIVLTFFSIKKCMGIKCATISLLLFVLNPVTYFIIHWHYTMVYSLPVSAGIIYFFTCLICPNKTQNANSTYKIFYYIGISVLTVLGYYMRPTSVIPSIAIGIYGLLCIKQTDKHSLKQVLKNLVIAIILAFGMHLTIAQGIARYVPDQSHTMPATHWIMMGLHGNGTVSASDILNTSSYNTKAEAKEAINKEIFQQIDKLGIPGLLEHQVRKLGSTWSEGANASNYIGALRSAPKSASIYNYTVGNRKEFLNLYSQSYYECLLLFVMLFLLYNDHKKPDLYFVSALSLLGGIIFYLIWEAKTVYSVSFLEFITILASNSLFSLDLPCFNNKKHYVQGGIIICSLTTLFFICGYNQYSKTEYTTTNNIIFCSFNEFIYDDHLSDLSVSNGKIKQSFITDKSFDQIQIHAKALDVKLSTQYCVRLIDNNSHEVFNKILTSQDVQNNVITLDIDTVIPTQKFFRLQSLMV